MNRSGSISLAGNSAQPVRRRSVIDSIMSFRSRGESSNTQKAELLESEKIGLFSECVLTQGEPPKRRSGHTSTLVGNKLVIFGGRDLETKVHYADLVVLELDTMTWSRPTLTGPTISPRSLHTATLLDDDKTIFVIGGTQESAQNKDSVFINTETWSVEVVDISNMPGHGVAGHSTVYLAPNEVFVFGGRLSTSGRVSSQVMKYNLQSREWTLLADKGPSMPRAGHSSTILYDASGKQYIGIFGGKNGDETVDEKVMLFDPKTYSWHLLETCGKGPSKTRHFHTAVLVQSIVFFIGGRTEYDDNGMKSIYSLDTKKSKWKKIKDTREMSIKGRFGHTANVYNDVIYIFGGERKGKSLNDVHVLKIGEASTVSSETSSIAGTDDL